MLWFFFLNATVVLLILLYIPTVMRLNLFIASPGSREKGVLALAGTISGDKFVLKKYVLFL